MKKILILLIISVGILFLINNEKMVVVPDEAIRFRVISASNSKEDIEIKEKVALNIMNNFSEMFNKNSIEESRNEIVNNLDKVEKIIDETFKNNNYPKKYDINYGINYFPEKIYKGVKYNSGYYESLVIKIDKGNGSNYWCVMFPPLCMIDESVPKEEYEYKFLVKEIIDKIKSIKEK